jgi:aryl sulfotransferase
VRDLPNVLFVHYRDLNSDTESEMRRIAAFCGIAVDDAAWPELVASVGFDAMRAEARERNRMAMSFEGGADTFFFKGADGRWRDVLTAHDLALYDRSAATNLEPDLRHWLEHGRQGGEIAT